MTDQPPRPPEAPVPVPGSPAAEPVNASALVRNDAGQYLMHLRDHLPGLIWEPGAWSLLGGGREPEDRSLEETVRRELLEEAGLDLPVLEPYAVEIATGTDSAPVPVAVYSGRWNGDPEQLTLTEGVMLRWFAPEVLHRLRLSRSTLDLVLRHAAEARGASSSTGEAAAPPPPLPSVLAVHAHPDDESLFSGGVLARHAAAGARTAVVTATWAEGTHRAEELARALEILGAGPPRLLGYADAKVPESAPGRPRFLDAPLDEAVGAVVAHIRAVRPQVVIAPDPYGGMTGHPDHVHAHRVTALAVRASGLARLHPEAGAPWQPSALYLATHPRSAAEVVGARLGRRGLPVDAFLVSDDAWITTTVDVTPWLPRKLAAILAHRSEVVRGAAPGRIAALSPDDRHLALSTEWYIRRDLALRSATDTALRA
ncbi:NUDIX domain-containing protein [Streptomyces sp. SID8359]|nr:NUDIX domain-containing protein [Streptomyces sp. SID8359]PWS39744.1 NUDIX domain-containing protein [Streptomyces sp. ZEA17I]